MEISTIETPPRELAPSAHRRPPVPVSDGGSMHRHARFTFLSALAPLLAAAGAAVVR